MELPKRQEPHVSSKLAAEGPEASEPTIPVPLEAGEKVHPEAGGDGFPQGQRPHRHTHRQARSRRVRGEPRVEPFRAYAFVPVPMAMTVLARVLPYRASRIANIAAATFKTLAVVGSLALAHPNAHYLFFATIEVTTTLTILVLAWRWRPDYSELPSPCLASHSASSRAA